MVGRGGEGLVAVHCTHGLNRSGFFIVTYLVEVSTRVICGTGQMRYLGQLRHLSIAALGSKRHRSSAAWGQLRHRPIAPPVKCGNGQMRHVTVVHVTMTGLARPPPPPSTP